jgi:hypothetical protein
MARFHYHVRQGKFSNSGIETVFEGDGSARQEAPALCGALARDIFAGLGRFSRSTFYVLSQRRAPYQFCRQPS